MIYLISQDGTMITPMRGEVYTVNKSVKVWVDDGVSTYGTYKTNKRAEEEIGNLVASIARGNKMYQFSRE